jgi:hypothetical protein
LVSERTTRRHTADGPWQCGRPPLRVCVDNPPPPQATSCSEWPQSHPCQSMHQPGTQRPGHPCYSCAGPLATAVQQALSRAAESPRAPGLARAREDPPLSIVQAATDAMMLVESSIELVGYRSPWGTRRQSRLLQRWTRRQSRLLQRCPSPPRDRAPPSSWLCASPAMAFLTAYGILGQARS